MERAVTPAKVRGANEIDKGMGAAAVHQRCTHEDLLSIVNGRGHRPSTTHTVTDQRQWLSQSTSAWANFGTRPTAPTIKHAADGDLEGAIDER
ncbi:hypothetical protein [Arthrobacter sp. OV608]|uniref:hypothetical protein n=1 Tax=Arthrobacter sp. OV608 TaxID=1882768 RepID=UPI0008BD6C75|nr:hypothetical protein [Arthrobacter sp. OV608]SER32639.1 hypothetical protein SAMN05444745_13612 [Arthrobacter sp. OV608]